MYLLAIKAFKELRYLHLTYDDEKDLTSYLINKLLNLLDVI
jgi:hypothetical protein